MKIVVYTAAFGDKFGFVPQKKQPNIDYVCFTDQRRSVPKPWKKVLIDKSDFPNKTLDSRHKKILPHLFFKDYDYSVFMDSNFLIIGSIEKAIKEMEGYKMGIFDHNQASDKRDCVYDEFDAIIELGKKKNKFKDTPEVMKKQIDFIKSEGYPKNNGLIFSRGFN